MTSCADAVPVELHGVSLELHSSERDFAAYASRALAAMLPSSPLKPMIVSRLEWVDEPPSTDLPSAFGVREWDRQLDRDLYIAGETAYWLRIDDFRDLQLKIAWVDGRLEVTGRYHFQLGKSPRWESLRRVRYRNRLSVLRARRFSTLVYYLVYHPLLWWLSRFCGWHVMHAGAVANDGRAHVLVGLPGSGKSTLSIGALAVSGFEMMSDNLLLTNGDKVRACPEVLLLDEGSTARIGSAAEQLMETGERRQYSRVSYRPDRFRLDALAPHAIHILGRSRHGNMRCLDHQAAAGKIEASSLLAKEVRRSRIMAHVCDLLTDTRPPDEYAIALSLASRAPCFETWIAPDEAPSDVVQRRLLGIG